MRASLALVLAVALALSGCIQNMTDLKDRLGASEEEPVQPAAVETPPAVEPTAEEPAPKVTKPPVARISIFGPNGALVFKSTFQAEDVIEPLRVVEKAKLSLIASDSETVEPGASLTTFAWTLSGKPLDGGRQVTVEMGAGLHLLTLVVTDSHGKTDNQTLTLAAAPLPVDVVTELMTGPVAGAAGQGPAGEAAFELSLSGAGIPNAMITAVKFEAKPPAACDAILDVVDPEGTSMGPVDNGGNGGTETISGGALAEGTYAISVAGFACAAAEGVPVTVTVTYLQMIEGLGGHDEHAH